MEQQLFNANRYYAESNPNISELMSKELHNSPEVFLKRLVDRWNWHNSYYEDLLEPAFSNIVKNERSSTLRNVKKCKLLLLFFY